MPRAASVVIENNFTKGLITEASGLNFPENSCYDTYDCIFTQTGVVLRRLGFDYETGFELNFVSSDLSNSVLTEYVWKNVSNLGDLSFVVTQVGSTISFYEVSNSDALSSNKKAFSIDLTGYMVSGAPGVTDTSAQFASGNGDLFIFHPYIDPMYVSYDSDGDSITVTPITIQVRDFEVQDDGLEIEERPSTLSTLHKYNLYNQSWYAVARTRDDGTINVLTSWDLHRSDFPSKAEVWWLYKDADLDFAPDRLPDTHHFGNTPAANGHYILDAFYQDRSAVSGIPGIPVVSSSYFRPSVGAFYASRVFYAGVNYKEFASKIYFSPILESTKQYGHAYQAYDPTSEDTPELLPTDGGVIIIPEIGNIFKMVSIELALVIFASNGVWAVTGSTGVGFAANDYSVSKISSINAISDTSFVDIEGLPSWWNTDGIYTIQIDPVQNKIKVVSMSDETIKSFMNDIPTSSLYFAKGAYNSLDKTVQWVYRNTVAETIKERYMYDRILVFNMLTQAYYPWTISQPANGPYLSGVISVAGQGIVRGEAVVVTELGDTVVDGSGNTVVVSSSTTEQLSASFRYPTIVFSGGSYRLTFSQERNTSYVDWLTFDGDGTSYSSYFLTGYKIHGEAQKKFQNNYIVIFSETEENSSCYVQNIWDYAEDSDTSRFSMPQQIYPIIAGNYTVVSRRLRMRGHGKTLQLKFYSDEGMPFNIVGWSAFETGNATL